jgi:hypothetical protein
MQAASSPSISDHYPELLVSCVFLKKTGRKFLTADIHTIELPIDNENNNYGSSTTSKSDSHSGQSSTMRTSLLRTDFLFQTSRANVAARPI